MKTLSILLALCVFFTPYTHAQEITSDEEIPQRYIEEAADVQQECQYNNVLNRYYDCECRALKFLEERIKQGEAVTRYGVETRIHNECWDVTEIAGKEYNICLNTYTRYLDGLSPNQYCECYSNTYAKLTRERKPQISPSKLVPLRMLALSECKKPQFYDRYARKEVPQDQTAPTLEQ